MKNKGKQKYRVFIVEDHLIMREGLCLVVEQEEDLEVCGVAEDVNSALLAISEKIPDLVIVDISLKKSNGLDLVKHLQKKSEKPLILVLSMHNEGVYAQRALKAGAQGYLMKHEENQKFIQAIHQILEGKIYISESVSQQMLLQSFSKKDQGPTNLVEMLSDRELEVFEMIGRGAHTKKIAETLFLSPKTVATYRDRIREKLHLESTPKLIEFAIQWTMAQDFSES